MQYTTALA